MCLYINIWRMILKNETNNEWLMFNHFNNVCLHLKKPLAASRYFDLGAGSYYQAPEIYKPCWPSQPSVYLRPKCCSYRIIVFFHSSFTWLPDITRDTFFSKINVALIHLIFVLHSLPYTSMSYAHWLGFLTKHL